MLYFDGNSIDKGKVKKSINLEHVYGQTNMSFFVTVTMVNNSSENMHTTKHDSDISFIYTETK